MGRWFPGYGHISRPNTIFLSRVCWRWREKISIFAGDKWYREQRERLSTHLRVVVRYHVEYERLLSIDLRLGAAAPGVDVKWLISDTILFSPSYERSICCCSWIRGNNTIWARNFDTRCACLATWHYHDKTGHKVFWLLRGQFFERANLVVITATANHKQYFAQHPWETPSSGVLNSVYTWLRDEARVTWQPRAKNYIKFCKHFLFKVQLQILALFWENKSVNKNQIVLVFEAFYRCVNCCGFTNISFFLKAGEFQLRNCHH